MDPIIADRCDKMTLSDAFDGFQNYLNPPTRLHTQGGLLLATFPQWPRLVGPLYERGIRLSQTIQPETGVVLALRASLPMTLGRLAREKRRPYCGLGCR